MNNLVVFTNDNTVVIPQTEQKQSSAANYIVYVLLAVVLAFVIGYLIWKLVKNKVQKKKLEKIEAKKAEETLSSYYEYILSFEEVIKYAQNELKNFEVSIGDRTMGEIKNGSKKLLYKLISRDDFASSFVNNEQYKTFVEHAELINITPCNLWDKKIPETIKYFADQYELVPEGEKKQNYLELVRKSIENQYYA
ncbi:MHJ_0274 family protein [Metamycoplasma neophronis]|uniref:DUF4129 domain-containing protein n=1 Tax=Metamycoplasma neophronis TaxID=872983 RepID=A0ABY2Z0X9_9BACT|nr:hypothetical protein [Metamycoplasma neophronis]TPR54067.1 hypothetical protein FJR74_01335 [Metamycoplasma neophronis]